MEILTKARSSVKCEGSQEKCDKTRVLSNHGRSLISSPNRNTNHPDRKYPCQKSRMSTAPNRHTSFPHTLRQYDLELCAKIWLLAILPLQSLSSLLLSAMGHAPWVFPYCLSAAGASLIRIRDALVLILSIQDLVDWFYTISHSFRPYFPFQTPLNSDSQVSLSLSPFPSSLIRSGKRISIWRPPTTCQESANGAPYLRDEKVIRPRAITFD